MSQTRMNVSNNDWKKINSALDQVQDNGREIRQIFQSYYQEGEENMEWEVDAAVISFSMFSSGGLQRSFQLCILLAIKDSMN